MEVSGRSREEVKESFDGTNIHNSFTNDSVQPDSRCQAPVSRFIEDFVRYNGRRLFESSHVRGLVRFTKVGGGLGSSKNDLVDLHVVSSSPYFLSSPSRFPYLTFNLLVVRTLESS